MKNKTKDKQFYYSSANDIYLRRFVPVKKDDVHWYELEVSPPSTTITVCNLVASVLDRSDELPLAACSDFADKLQEIIDRFRARHQEEKK